MAIKRIISRTGFISAAISDSSTVLLVDATFLSLIAASVNFAGGDYFYMSLEEGEKVEEIKVTGQGISHLVIERGDNPQAFSAAAKYNTALTHEAVLELAATMTPVPTFNITGSGAATVTSLGGGNFDISVPVPTIQGTSGIEVAGSHPNWVVGLVAGAGCCPSDEEGPGEGGSTELIAAGIVSISAVGSAQQINVDAPNFTGTGLTVTGTWPNLTFNYAGGGGGTVTSVGVGAGLTLTGNPALDPTLSITNTGVAAGNYAGVVINAKGQFTAVPLTFAPISVATPDGAIQIARAAGSDEITIGVTEAAVGTLGVVALADADDPLNETDETTAVTPRMLAEVIADLEGTVPYGGQTYSGEADGDYTETLPTSGIALTLVAGETALVFANTTARGGVFTDPVNYAIGVFEAGGTRIQANRKINQNNQSMQFSIAGPYVGSLVLKHTALGVGETMHSYSLHALKM